MADSAFESRIEQALEDETLRRNFASALGAFAARRRSVFPDGRALERLRTQAAAIRDRALARLPELLEELESRLTANGIRVHWAETAAVGCRLVLEILEAHGVRRVVKGKSMVSEEMHLNAFLARHGIETVETDLGEFIIQLAGETPAHIIVPAVHKNRAQIARLFQEKIAGAPYTEEVTELNAIARRTLRERFREAGAGLSGVNFAVAETGTLCLVENEGNGRMCTGVPPLHIAVMGIEKVIERLEDLPPLLRLLTGSATGQRVTTYVNLISGPRRNADPDGPREVHLVLLDNGRSAVYADPELRATLRCIRCGCCLNHCPVYARIGGHAYGTTYPGPIGKVLTPQLLGIDRAGELPFASTLCGACEEVCPVRIPLAHLLRRLRAEAVRSPASRGDRRGSGRPDRLERLAWWAWGQAVQRPSIYRAILAGGRWLGGLLPPVGPLERWMRTHAEPRFSRRNLRRILRRQGIPDA